MLLKNKWIGGWERVFSRRMLICVFTGFASGLPLYLLINLLPAWLRSAGLNLATIGLFTLIQLPFTWKFLWAPLLDRFVPLRLGRRRGWMLLTQVVLLITMMLFALFQPLTDLRSIVVLATLVAFFSASQDIVLDAFRTEILTTDELGLGNAIHITAYQLASLVPGSLSLVLADYLPWSTVFFITALFMLLGIGATLIAKEPEQAVILRHSLQEAVIVPFRELLTRNGVRSAFLLLLFMCLYKLGDSMVVALAIPFYIDMGFSMSEIGLVAKHAGLWPRVVGGILGGLWMLKSSINRALWIFGALQLASIIGFAWLATAGPFPVVSAFELLCLGGVIGFEALGVGLGTAALVAFIAKNTHPAYTATQFALFTSIVALPRTAVSALTGYIVEAIGWAPFFLLCAALAMPGMMLLLLVAPWKKNIK